MALPFPGLRKFIPDTDSARRRSAPSVPCENRPSCTLPRLGSLLRLVVGEYPGDMEIVALPEESVRGDEKVVGTLRVPSDEAIFEANGTRSVPTTERTWHDEL